MSERLRAENKLLWAELARLPNSLAAPAFGRVRDAMAVAPDPCFAGHDTSEMLWPETAHQGVWCRRCKEFLPC